MLIVDPWHWLEPDGSFPSANPHLRRQILRVARFIEYAGPLKHGESRGTLVECKKRPNGKPCNGLMWVEKEAEHDTIHAFCIGCGTAEAVISNWQKTPWADGMMEPVQAEEVLPGDFN